MEKDKVPTPGEFLQIAGIDISSYIEKKWYKYLNEGLKAIENCDFSYAEQRLKNCVGCKSESVAIGACCLAALGYYYIVVEDFDQALLLYHQALQTWLTEYSEDDRRSLVFLGALATVKQFSDKYSEAKEIFSKALNISQKVNGAEHEITVFLMQRVAGCLSEMSQFDQAGELYDRAISVLQSNDATRVNASLSMHYSLHPGSAEHRSLSSSSSSHSTSPSPSSAVQVSVVICLYEKSRNLRKKYYTAHVTSTAMAYEAMQKDEDHDKEWIEKLLQLYQGNKRKTVQALAGLATHQRALGFSYYAAILYEKALVVAGDIKVCFELSNLHANLAETYRDLRVYSQALSHFDTALQLLETIRASNLEKIGIMAEKARLLHEMNPGGGNDRQAAELFEAALAMLGESQHPNGIVVLRLFAEFLKLSPASTGSVPHTILSNRARAMELHLGIKLQL